MNSHDIRGFTLIEVMVALSLLAVALALSFGTLRGATVSTQRAEIVAGKSERLRAVQGFLRTQLSGALPMTFATEPDADGAIFLRGAADKLEFVANMPGYLSRGGPYLQTLQLERGTHGQQLVFRHQLLTPDGPIADEREPEILLDGIAEGSFDYETMDDKGRPGDWKPTWQSDSMLPPLVRIRLRFQDEHTRWPGFLVAVRAATQ